MRRIIVLLVLLLALVACQNNGGTNDQGTPGDDNGGDGVPTVDSPRPVVTPTPTLPATYTPRVMEHQGHLYLLPVAGAGTRIIHTVQAGETLAILGSRYDIAVDDLIRLNGIEDGDHIEVGDTLVIPLQYE